jgi:hypothetical protein
MEEVYLKCGPQNGVDILEKRRIFCPSWEPVYNLIGYLAQSLITVPK